jgi:hypothetical protein
MGWALPEQVLVKDIVLAHKTFGHMKALVISQWQNRKAGARGDFEISAEAQGGSFRLWCSFMALIEYWQSLDAQRYLGWPGFLLQHGSAIHNGNSACRMAKVAGAKAVVGWCLKKGLSKACHPELVLMRFCISAHPNGVPPLSS